MIFYETSIEEENNKKKVKVFVQDVEYNKVSNLI